MTDEQKAEAAERFKALSKDHQPVKQVNYAVHRGENRKRYQPIIKKAEGLLESSSTAGAYNLQSALNELLEALNGEDDAAIQKAADALVDVMFELENDF
jgi:hypothetical protein